MVRVRVDDSGMLFASVALPLPLDEAFTYRVPEKLVDRLRVGSRVLVPFGRRRLTGVVVATSKHTDIPEDKLRSVSEILDAEPAITPDLLELAEWMADYYMCSLGEAVSQMVPPGTKIASKKVYRLEGDAYTSSSLTGDEEQVVALIRRGDSIEEELLKTKLKKAGVPLNCLKSLVKKGVLTYESVLSRPKAQPKVTSFYELAAPVDAEVMNKLKKRAPKQASIVEALLAADSPLSITAVRAASGTHSALAALIKKGIIRKSAKRELRTIDEDGLESTGVVRELTQAQMNAVSKTSSLLEAGEFQVILLHGVTGSGKTEVYAKASEKAVDMGRGVIILVPEIALTPHMIGYLSGRFGDLLTVVHSGLSPGERLDIWTRIRNGDARVVVGPRSALLTPVKDIGLIIVDEEHEGTYKQNDPPRYHARDVAVVRGKLAGAPVVLGSATPSMESYSNAVEGKYDLVSLPERIDSRPLPDVTIVDMRDTIRHGSFSEELLAAMKDALSRGKQIILFINRRGFSSFLQCTDCGETIKCDRCSVAMTYHSSEKTLRCHYCDLRKGVPDQCHKCGSHLLRYGAPGTQKIEQELCEILPQAKVIRMDADTTRRKGAAAKILKEFERGEYDILLGTQMVAKGFDFPNVEVVGAVSADCGLNLPDFRAAERTFQLMTQVAGRSGRGPDPGRVFIQSFNPEHYSIRLAKDQKFEPLYEKEVGMRKPLGYPPFSHLALVVVRSKDRSGTQKVAMDMAGIIRKNAPALSVLGPAPAPIEKLAQSYRWHVLIKSRSRRALKEGLRSCLEKARTRPGGAIVTIDIDPIDML
jgi:primosomal protein N' (replication factor Y)